MTSPITGLSSAAAATTAPGLQALQKKPTPANQDLQVREKFQEFVAGTFYKQMLKSLRSTQGKPAYFHGGQAEEIFQGQMDEYVTDDLAKSHGGGFADKLYEAYAQSRSTAPAPKAAASLDVTA